MNSGNFSNFSGVVNSTSILYKREDNLLTLEEIVILTIWGSCMLLVGVIGNTVMLWIILRKPAMRSAINLLLASIAVTDLLLVNISLPFNILTLLHNKCFLSVICSSQSFVLLLLLTHSALPLTGACLHRYIANTFRREVFTELKVALFTISTWIFSFLFSLIPVILNVPFFAWCSCTAQVEEDLEPSASRLAYVVSAFVIAICLPACVILYSFLHMLCFRNTENSACSAHSYSTIVMSLTQNSDVPVNTKSMTTIIIISLIFLMTKSPLYISQVLQYSTNSIIKGQIWLVWWTYMGSALNPLVYAIKVPKYRKTVRNFLPLLSGYYLLKRQAPRRNPKKIYEIKQTVRRLQSHGKVTPVNSTSSSIISLFNSNNNLAVNNSNQCKITENSPILTTKLQPFYSNPSIPIGLPSVCVDNVSGTFTELYDNK